MTLLLAILMINVLLAHPALTSTTDSSFYTPESMNNTTYSYPNSSSIMSGTETTDSLMTTQSLAASKEQQEPLVSTATKDLVLEIINCGFLPIICLFGIMGNIMSLIILSIQGSQERTNIILVGLSFSDTVFLTMTMLRKLSCLVSKFDMDIGFDLNMIMQSQALVLYLMFGRLTSSMTMLISIERFIAVYFPLQANVLLTSKRIKIAVGILYVFLLSAMAPLLALYKIVYVFSKQRTIPLLQVTQFHEDNFEFFEIYLNQVLNFAFRYTPMILVCICTTLTIIRIKKSTSWRRSSSNVTKDADQVTSMLILVSCIYIVCLVPGTITLTLRYFIDGFDFFGAYSNIFSLLGAIAVLVEAFNSSVNFIVYMAMSKKFSATYKRVFLCRRNRSRYSEGRADLNTTVSTVDNV